MAKGSGNTRLSASAKGNASSNNEVSKGAPKQETSSNKIGLSLSDHKIKSDNFFNMLKEAGYKGNGKDLWSNKVEISIDGKWYRVTSKVALEQNFTGMMLGQFTGAKRLVKLVPYEDIYTSQTGNQFNSGEHNIDIWKMDVKDMSKVNVSFGEGKKRKTIRLKDLLKNK